MDFKFIPGKNVEVPEIFFKDKISLPASKTALIIVDMQNDFIRPEGTLIVEAAKETIPNIRDLLNAAREKGVRIVYTQDTQVENDPEFDIWPQHCKINTWG